MVIGLCNEEYKVKKSIFLPGWEKSTYGLHSDDASIHTCGSKGKYCGPFAAGDVIGCGIDHSNNSLFWTRNGNFLGKQKKIK